MNKDASFYANICSLGDHELKKKHCRVRAARTVPNLSLFTFPLCPPLQKASLLRVPSYLGLSTFYQLRLYEKKKVLALYE